jgi:hypothetical protein
MKFRYLSTRDDTLDFYDKLVGSLLFHASSQGDHKAVFRPNFLVAKTLFFEAAGIWAMLTDGLQTKAKNRYWNCFGIGGDQHAASTRISVEINHPHDGIDRRIAGRFLRSEAGRYAIGHTGRLGGGKEGITKDAFRSFAGIDGIVVEIDGRNENLALLCFLDEGQKLVDDLSRFVHSAQAFRDHLMTANPGSQSR